MECAYLTTFCFDYSDPYAFKPFVVQASPPPLEHDRVGRPAFRWRQPS
jgi:hypothetical protein